MAELKSIKTSIENNTYQCSFTIFKYSNVDFIPYQYVNEISKQQNLSVLSYPLLPPLSGPIPL